MSNVILGSDGISIRQGIYETSASQKTELGRFLEFEDGRLFRYCKNGGTKLERALLVQSKVIDDTSSVDLVLAAAVVAGDKTISLTIPSAHATFAANAYQDGYVLIETTSTPADEGQLRKIKSHPAFTTGSDATVVFTVYDAFEAAVAISGSYARIQYNPYFEVVVGATTAAVVGVPLIDVPASYYFWVQVRGVGPLVNDNNSSIAIEDAVMHSTAGEVRTHTAGSPIVGTALGASDDSDDAFIANLLIE